MQIKMLQLLKVDLIIALEGVPFLLQNKYIQMI